MNLRGVSRNVTKKYKYDRHSAALPKMHSHIGLRCGIVANTLSPPYAQSLTIQTMTIWHDKGMGHEKR